MSNIVAQPLEIFANISNKISKINQIYTRKLKTSEIFPKYFDKGKDKKLGITIIKFILFLKYIN